MKLNWKKIIGITAGIALAALVVFKLKSNKNIATNKVYTYDKNLAVNVQADTLKLVNVDVESYFSGTFEPNKETKISAEIQGKINTILVDLGSIVSKGQTLVLLDNSILKLQLQTMDVQIEGLESDVKRYTVLAKAEAIQGVQLEKAELGLKSAKVQRTTLLEQINKTTIKAPFNGIVTAKLSEEGSFASPGIPLLQITDIKTLKFTVNVPENDLSKFKINQTYLLSVDAYPELTVSGKTSMMGSKANVGSSFPVQFTLINTPDLKIKSGMFGKVYLKNTSQEKGIVITSSSIVGSADQPQIYLIKNGKSVLHDITISKKIKNSVVVKSGLNEGDIIVTNGFINLFDGANVSIKN